MPVKLIDPESLRGRLAVRFKGLIDEFRAALPEMSAEAASQKLTLNGMLAAILTECAIEEFEKCQP